MKRILIAVLAIMIAAAQAPAQNTPAKQGKPRKDHKMKSPQEKADKVTEWMTKELTLSPEQATKVKVINLTAFLKTNSLKADTAIKGEQRKMQHQAIKLERRYALKEVLTPEQIEKLKASLKTKKELHKEKKADRIQDGKVDGPSKAPKRPNLTDEELDDLLDE